MEMESMEMEGRVVEGRVAVEEQVQFHPVCVGSSIRLEVTTHPSIPPSLHPSIPRSHLTS